MNGRCSSEPSHLKMLLIYLHLWAEYNATLKVTLAYPMQKERTQNIYSYLRI